MKLFHFFLVTTVRLISVPLPTHFLPFCYLLSLFGSITFQSPGHRASFNSNLTFFFFKFPFCFSALIGLGRWIWPVCFFLIDFILQSSCRATEKLGRKFKEFPYIPVFTHTQPSPLAAEWGISYNQISYNQSGAFPTTSRVGHFLQPLTPHYHPGPQDALKFTLGCPFHGLDKRMACTHNYSVTENSFPALNTLRALFILPPPEPLATVIFLLSLQFCLS